MNHFNPSEWRHVFGDILMLIVYLLSFLFPYVMGGMAVDTDKEPSPMCGPVFIAFVVFTLAAHLISAGVIK